MTQVYRRLTEDLNIYEWNSQDEKEYKLFCEFVWKSDQGDLLLEFSLNKEMKQKLQFIRQFSKETGFTIKDLLKLFMEKIVFKLFQIIGWSFDSLLELLKKGYVTYKSLQSAILDFIDNAKTIDWTKDKLKELNSFIKTHPKTKRIVGINVAGLLVYIWLTMAFTGNNLDTFNIASIFMVLNGNFSLFSFFNTPIGIKILSSFVSGTYNNLIFPWSNNKLSVMVFTTLSKYFHKKLSKGDDLEHFKAIKSS